MTNKSTTAQELDELLGKVDLEQIIRDDLLKEIKEIHDEQMNTIILHPEVYKNMKYNRPMNFLEKLEASWWWTTQIFEEWCWQMTHEEDWEFFDYLQIDYVKYEEDMYYQKRGTKK